jgi:hypothetical protein
MRMLEAVIGEGLSMVREIGGGVPFFRYMDHDGDGSGEKNHNHDHTNGEVVRITPPVGMVFIVTSVLVWLKVDSDKMEAYEYGAAPALTNGITMGILQDGQLVTDTTDGVPIKTNIDWMRVGRRYEYLKGKKDFYSYWLSWWEYVAVGEPAFLDGTLKQEFVMYLNDDFSHLLEHYFIVFGYARPKQQPGG